MNRRGIILVLVSALLALLAIAALVMTRLSQAGRAQSRVAVEGVRARLLARSGVERVRMEMPRTAYPGYGGEDYDGTGGFSDPVETTAQSYAPTVLDVEACPVLYALRPTFFASDGSWADLSGDPAPDRTEVDGNVRGYSGRLRSQYVDRRGLRGDTYILRVRLDEGICVNGGDPAAGAGVGYNAVVASMLTTLAEAIDRCDGVNNGLPVDGADAAPLMALRPPAGWGDWAQVEAVAFPAQRAKLDALRPYLTLRGWADRKVIAPTAVPAMSGVRYASWGDFKDAHVGNGGPVPPFESIGGRNVGRRPVYLAWARRNRPVLLALLANLSGIEIDPRRGTPLSMVDMSIADTVGLVSTSTIALDTAAGNWSAANPTLDDCRRVANALQSQNPAADVLEVDGRPDGEIDTWEEWNRFCDMLPLSQAQRDILKSNFNPNGDLNKFNPAGFAYRSVDKMGLLTRSTEFSLFPTGGILIESAGRVVDSRGRMLASAVVETSLAGPSVVRLTSQGEFACDDLGNLDVAGGGDETSFRLPGYVGGGGRSLFITESRGSSPTWGHTIDQGGVYAGTWMQGVSGGTSLQTYPSPCLRAVPGGALSIAPVAYDGTLQLATIETPTDEYYAYGGAVRNMMCLARFDDRWDLDVSDAAVPGMVADTRTPALDAPLLGGGGPGTFLPDGVYSESARSVAYASAGNLHDFHGVVSFWVKPNQSRASMYNRGHCWLDMYNSDGSQAFWLGDKTRNANGYGVTAHIEVGSVAEDGGREHQFGRSIALGSSQILRRWYLVSFYWNLQAPDAHSCGELVVDAGASDGRPDIYDGSSPLWTNAAADASPLSRNEHILVLGLRSAAGGAAGNSVFDTYYGSGSDATFDELAIYDFGTDEASVDTFSSSRYQAGRYEKGWVYHPPGQEDSLPDAAAPCYHTAPIRLPSGTVLREVRWSFLRPPSLQADYAEVEIVREDGTGYLWDEASCRSTKTIGRDPARQDWPVGRLVDQPFRLRVLFRRPSTNPADPEDPNSPRVPDSLPILESPILDEIVLVTTPRSGPPVLAWSE
ncbi:MAG: hypothetical protein HY608_10780 [Planctomycetes bacterium]|nr:hypothetical protein [Planctomycetota bacterium]